jgi:hypothetical protein
MFRTRAGLATVSALVIGGVFAPSALATTPLTVSKTATAHWTRTYDWTIEKSVAPASHTLETGQSASSTYTVAVTKSSGVEARWVDGEVCVSNDASAAPTEGLAITDRIVVLKANGNTQTLDSTTIDTSANPVLDPGESHCYAYSFPFEPFPDAVGYENRTRATILNDERGPGEPFGPSAEAPFTAPSAPTVTNDAVNVDDTNGMSWLVSASGTKTYSRTFTCDRDKGMHTNTAKIRETGQSASATVTVTCKDKPKDCPKGDHDKGKKKKGHGYGSSYGDRGDDHRSSSYGQRGRDDDCKDDHSGGHDDDSDDSSDDSDDSDDGDCKGDRRGWGH